MTRDSKIIDLALTMLPRGRSPQKTKSELQAMLKKAVENTR